MQSSWLGFFLRRACGYCTQANWRRTLLDVIHSVGGPSYLYNTVISGFIFPFEASHRTTAFTKY